jgi:hypothetical protein
VPGRSIRLAASSGRRILCDRIHSVGDMANLDAALLFERHLTEADRLDVGATGT